MYKSIQIAMITNPFSIYEDLKTINYRPQNTNYHDQYSLYILCIKTTIIKNSNRYYEYSVHGTELGMELNNMYKC